MYKLNLALFYFLIFNSPIFSQNLNTTSKEFILWGETYGTYNNPRQWENLLELPLCFLSNNEENYKANHFSKGIFSPNLIRLPLFKFYHKKDFTGETLCQTKWNLKLLNKLNELLVRDAWILIHIENIPLRVFIGENNSNESCLYTNYKFTFIYYNDTIIEVILDPTDCKILKEGDNTEFTYSSHWIPSSTAKKLDTTSQYSVKGHLYKANWCSLIINIIVSLLLITNLLIILHQESPKYSPLSDGSSFFNDESDYQAYKDLERDVFRKPTKLLVFSVFYGCGWQLIATILMFITITTVKKLFKISSSSYEIFFFVIIITQFVNGYYSSYVYCLYNGKYFGRATFCQLMFIPTGVLLIYNLSGFVTSDSTSFLRFDNYSLLMIISCFTFVNIPLHLIGLYLGRRNARNTKFPCSVSKLKRAIPKKPRFLMTLLYTSVGLIPFFSCLTQYHTWLDQFWSYNRYQIDAKISILMIVVLINISLTVPAFVYIVLNLEDYRWIWKAFGLNSASCCSFFIYSVYNLMNSKMTGAPQISSYLLTNLTLSFILYFVMGSISVASSYKFVEILYKNIKNE